MRRLIVFTAPLVLGLAGATLAAGPASEEKPGRFTMQPADGGFIRLDTATGDIAMCAKAGPGFECKPVKDDRDLQREIARLSDENKALKAEIKRLEELHGTGGEAGRPPQKFELPSEEDVDKALGYLERMFKKFRDKMKELDSTEPKKGQPL